MEYIVITAENFHPLSWSGGTTKELFIFPQTANYQQRNFQFRISMATVEADKSDFTSLRGISRKLMILSGKITICHEGHYSRQLNKFDVDSFEGDWKTSSIGKCTDFNLMTDGNTSGELRAMVVEKELRAACNIKGNCEWFFIYVFSGNISAEMNNKIITINKGDLLAFNKPTIKNLEIIGIENSELVCVEIT
jgi:uncharacterized protein